jgi:hypothetical protein
MVFMSAGMIAPIENGLITPPSETEAVTVPPTFQLEVDVSLSSFGPIVVTTTLVYSGYEKETLLSPVPGGGCGEMPASKKQQAPSGQAGASHPFEGRTETLAETNEPAGPVVGVVMNVRKTW